MISYLRGVCLEKTPTRLLLDVNGVGYELSITLNCYQKLPNMESATSVYTYLSVSENAMLLYGFADKNERETFLLLISISGIGPKLAQVVLSGIPADELKQAIVNVDINRLKSISGIGKKTAERIVVELKDKIEKMSDISRTKNWSSSRGATKMASTEQAILALLSLGYKKTNAERIITELLQKEPDLSVEELIKRSLRLI